MKVKLLILVGCFFSASLFAQQSEVRNVGSFRGIKSGQAIDVYLKKGDKESVKVEVTGIDLSDVSTEVAGNNLRISIPNNNWGWKSSKSVKVYVTYVALEKIAVSSAGNVFSDGTIRSSTMDIHVSSAANVEVAVESDALSIHASSAGEVNVSGSTRTLEVDASSAGEIDTYNLTAEDATAEASSAGDIRINVTKSLNAHASSGGSVRYRGSPMKSNTSSSSGGSVKKIG